MFRLDHIRMYRENGNGIVTIAFPQKLFLDTDVDRIQAQSWKAEARHAYACRGLLIALPPLLSSHLAAVLLLPDPSIYDTIQRISRD